MFIVRNQVLRFLGKLEGRGELVLFRQLGANMH